VKFEVPIYPVLNGEVS